MTPEELEIAKAACCVGTIWDQYEGTENFNEMVGIRVQHLIELVRNHLQHEQPKVELQAEQKPVDPSDDELQRHQDELYAFKVFATKQAREHHISFVHDFEWNNFCEGLLSYFKEKQKPGEWSKEDEKYLNLAINIVASELGENSPTVAWLKFLPKRFNLQPKQKWSEEDEKMLETFLHKLEVCDLLTNKEVRWAKLRLKSLKNRGNFPKSNTNSPHWKPSEEQMEALDNARFCKSYDWSELDLLYEELHKKYN